MKRRTFIAALGSTAAAWPLAARAQDRIPRIGWLSPASAEADKALFGAFQAGLRDLGYVPGQTVAIEARFANGHEDRMAELAKELVDLKVDVLVAGGPATYAAHRVTTTIPIVAPVTGDIVAMGIAASLAHPGGNVTGQTFFATELFVKRIAFLKQIKPSMTRVGMLVSQGLSSIPTTLRNLDGPVKALGLALETIEVVEPADCERALSSGPGASIGGLAVVDAPLFILGEGPAIVAAAALKRGLPTAGALPLARSGGLLGYGVDLVPMFRRAAVFVDKVLKGTKPGDIPIEQATKFLTVVNMKTAKALGLDIPPTLLAAADEVIE